MIKEISSENCDVVTMKIDNVSAIQLEKNPIAHSRRNLPYKVGLHGKPIATALRKWRTNSRVVDCASVSETKRSNRNGNFG